MSSLYIYIWAANAPPSMENLRGQKTDQFNKRKKNLREMDDKDLKATNPFYLPWCKGS
jgi:hypothetical protein